MIGINNCGFKIFTNKTIFFTNTLYDAVVGFYSRIRDVMLKERVSFKTA